MLFLLNANIPYSAKELFEELFGNNHEVFHVRDLHLETAQDTDIIVWAKEHKAALISRDFDFANILNFPPRNYFGIIVLKIPYFYSASDIKRVLRNFLKGVNLSIIPQTTIIIEETRFRTKK